jgi:hypothetical protein
MNEIGQMQFRLPGMSATDLQILAKEVSGQLARQIPAMPRNIELDEIRIQLNESQLASRGTLAGTISNQIIRQINDAIVRGT